MSDLNDWAAEQYRDECERLRRIVEALEAAESAGTPIQDLAVLASECGAASTWRHK